MFYSRLKALDAHIVFLECKPLNQIEHSGVSSSQQDVIVMCFICFANAFPLCDFFACRPLLELVERTLQSLCQKIVQSAQNRRKKMFGLFLSL